MLDPHKQCLLGSLAIRLRRDKEKESKVRRRDGLSIVETSNSSSSIALGVERRFEEDSKESILESGGMKATDLNIIANPKTAESSSQRVLIAQSLEMALPRPYPKLLDALQTTDLRNLSFYPSLRNVRALHTIDFFAKHPECACKLAQHEECEGARVGKLIGGTTLTEGTTGHGKFGEVQIVTLPADFRGKKELNVVMKKMPVIDGGRMDGWKVFSDSSNQNNRKEIRLAATVSLFVLSGRTIHFPVLYTGMPCESMKFLDEALEKKSKMMAYTQFLLSHGSWKKADQGDAVADKMKNMFVQRTNISAIELPENMFNEAARYSPSIRKSEDLKAEANEVYQKAASGSVMFSELAEEDLDSYIQRLGGDLSPTTLAHIVTQVIDGLMSLQQLGYMHLDMHSGNILLLDDDLRPPKVCVIHDFGKAVSFDASIPGEALRDANQFLHLLRTYTSFPPETTDMIDSLQAKAIDSCSSLRELNDIVQEYIRT